MRLKVLRQLKPIKCNPYYKLMQYHRNIGLDHIQLIKDFILLDRLLCKIIVMQKQTLDKVHFTH